MVNVAIMGYGNIGSGVAYVLTQNKELLSKKAGREINLKYILDLREFPGDPLEDKIVHDYRVIIEDPEVQIVVETMGGTRPAYQFVKESLLAGKSVATSNKELVAAHGAELLRIAEEKSVSFMFEASVGGGIPIIHPLNDCITSDEVTEITGILNGTTNYMLTRMAKDGVDFDTVLKQAQDLGYAERNPEADVEGFDACRKIAILASMAFGAQVDYEDVYTEGITKITSEDMKYANALGKAIKLFGTCKKQDGKAFAMVTPVMVGEGNPLYTVNDVMNGILVRSEVTGDLMFYGAGAGKLPTASAVVADVVEEVRSLNQTVMTRWSEEKMQLADYKESKKQFFLRIAGDEAAQKAALEVFAGAEVICAEGLSGEFGLVTPVISEGECQEKCAQVEGVLGRIRIAE